MSQRVALVVSTALTVIALLIGIGLAIRAGDAQGDADVAVSEDAAQSPSDADDLRQEYIDRLQTSNAALAASYERITALLDDIDQLRAQNAELREREALYEQRLAEANARLEQAGRPTVSVPSTTAGDAAPAQAPTSDDPPAASANDGSPRVAFAPDEPASTSSAPPSTPPPPPSSAPALPTPTTPHQPLS